MNQQPNTDRKIISGDIYRFQKQAKELMDDGYIPEGPVYTAMRDNYEDMPGRGVTSQTPILTQWFVKMK
jgi:hypothetical protein